MSSGFAVPPAAIAGQEAVASVMLTYGSHVESVAVRPLRAPPVAYAFTLIVTDSPGSAWPSPSPAASAIATE